MSHFPHADPNNATVTDSKFEFVTSNYSTPSMMETAKTSLIYILITLVVVGVCTLACIISCSLILHWKKGSLRESNVNHEYYEVIDPIYEAVNAVVMDSNHSGKRIRMADDENVHIKDNEAYIHFTSELDALQMDHNKSYVYQESPFNSSIPVIPEGLSLPLHRSVVKPSHCVITKTFNKRQVV